MIGAGGAGRAERRRQPAEAGAGARRTAHHRGHHLVRIQEVLRERSGAGAALPGGQGRRADRGASACVMLRGVVPALEKHHNVRILDEGLAAAVRVLAPLSARPAAAGQGGQRAGHGLRAAGAGPERDAAGDRRRHAADRRSAPCRRACWSGKPRWARITASGWQPMRQAARPPWKADWRELQGALGEGARPGRQASARSAASWKLASRRRRRRRRRRTARAGADRQPDPNALRAELAELNAELEALQGETPLMRVCVDAQIVGEVISGWTGIPVGKMLRDEIAVGAHARRAPGQARHRTGSRARHASASASARRRRGSKIPASRSACSCWWGRAASARRRRRWRWPTCSTAASAT